MKPIKAEDLPEHENVYLKKDWLGWRVVHPDHKFTGGKRNLFFLAVIIVLLGLAYLGVNELVSVYKQVAANPCTYCTDCQEQTRQVINQMNQKEIAPLDGIKLS